MKKFQLGPHINLYKIGFLKKSVIIREGIKFAAMNRIKTLTFIYLYKCQELNEAVGVIYILSNKTEISPRSFMLSVSNSQRSNYVTSNVIYHTHYIRILSFLNWKSYTKSYFFLVTHVIKMWGFDWGLVILQTKYWHFWNLWWNKV